MSVRVVGLFVPDYRGEDERDKREEEPGKDSRELPFPEEKESIMRGVSGPVLTDKKEHDAERAKAKRGGDGRGAKELPGRAS